VFRLSLSFSLSSLCAQTHTHRWNVYMHILSCSHLYAHMLSIDLVEQTH
jgi:hypothetical protein